MMMIESVSHWVVFFFFCRDLEEPYIPNERRWIKIKPEYLNGVGDNLDLVILGGFYGAGTGGRSGTPSHFLLGIAGPVEEGQKFGDVWHSFAKVGTGYNYSELSTMQYKLQPQVPWSRGGLFF